MSRTVIQSFYSITRDIGIDRRTRMKILISRLALEYKRKKNRQADGRTD